MEASAGVKSLTVSPVGVLPGTSEAGSISMTRRIVSAKLPVIPVRISAMTFACWAEATGMPGYSPSQATCGSWRFPVVEDPVNSPALCV